MSDPQELKLHRRHNIYFEVGLAWNIIEVKDFRALFMILL